MHKNLVFCILLAIYPTCLWAESVAQETRKTVTLRLSTNVVEMQYVKALLEDAYTSIGYKINWFNVSGSQELALVNTDKLAGALARNPIIEKEFPSLIKIPFKLFDFKLLKVGDRRRCGYCLDEDINSIIYSKGSIISEKHVQSLRSTMDKLAIHSTEKLNQMIMKRRADSVLIMDFQLDTEIIENPHMIIETIAHEYNYHYLSPDYKHLQKPLTDAFDKLVQNGTVAQLQKKYKIKWTKEFKQIPETVNFASGHWLDYSNADGTGIYWNIIDNVFDADFTITKSSSIWSRAIHAFEENRADVLVGSFRNKKLSNVIYSSFHIDYEYPLYAFMLNEDVATRFKAEDKSLTACLDSGSSLLKHAYFIQKENVIETSLAQCERLMEKGKVDVVIEFEYNLSGYMNALSKVNLVENSPIFLVFHDSPKGHFLKSYFDENIVILARSNFLKKVFPNDITYKQAHIRP